MTKHEVARFCGQLKMLLSSGVPLLEALQMVQHKSQAVILQKVAEGESLAQALQPFFPPMVISYVSGGEKAGNLEEALDYLQKYYAGRAETEERMKSALIYPAFVMVLCVLSLTVMIVFVLPGFKSLFADFEIDLPLFTRIIIGGGEMFARFGGIFLILAAGGVFYFLRYRKTEKGAWQVDAYALKVKFIRHNQIIQSFRTLGALLEGGISITAALVTTIHSIDNRIYKNIMLEVKKGVENGERMSEMLMRHAIFPREAIQMIRVGENTGNLGQMLIGVANFYEKEQEVFIKRFTVMLEPALTLAVGLVVAVIALAVFLPMVNMLSRLQ